MPPVTVTLEAHELDTRTHQWCPTCHTFALIEVDVALVNAETLEVVRRTGGSLCMGCGAED